jgi:hypothetical protein
MYSRTEHFLPEGYMDQEKVDRQINIKKSQEWCQLTSESVWKKLRLGLNRRQWWRINKTHGTVHYHELLYFMVLPGWALHRFNRPNRFNQINDDT